MMSKNDERYYIGKNPYRQSFSSTSIDKKKEKKLSAKERNKLKKEVLKDLQFALQLELSTIPPYLCALYSIEPDTNLVPEAIIKSVVLEEMLHMVLVANIMNSLGGNPVLTTKEVVPNYPSQGLPASGKEEDKVMKNLKIELKYFSQDTIRSFEKIEHPSGSRQFDDESNQSGDSIGDFYENLKMKINRLNNSDFKSLNQVTNEYYYGAGGHIITIANKKDALAAIDEIIEQGEGDGGFDWKDYIDQTFGNAIAGVAHYFRFKEVRYGRFYKSSDGIHRNSRNKGLPSGKKMDVDWTGFFPFKSNPTLKDIKEKDQELYEIAMDFSKSYMKLLKNLEQAFNGQPEKLKEGIPLMYYLKIKAVELMKIPYGDEGFTVGPTFEYVEL